MESVPTVRPMLYDMPGLVGETAYLILANEAIGRHEFYISTRVVGRPSHSA